MSTLVTKVDRAAKGVAAAQEGPNGQTKAIKNVIEMVKKNNIQVVDFKFNDLPGLW